MRCRSAARILNCSAVAAFLLCLPGAPLSQAGGGQPWARHVIDDSSRGADGVRLLDVNGDGLPDITTGWEEGGGVRVYLNPGAARVKGRWPAVTAGRVRSPEDAVLVDLDGDGAADVISSCEGSQRAMFVHWAPAEKPRYLDEQAWTTQALPAAQGLMQWMFALPLQVDGRHGVDLIAGGKNDNASLGWFEAPAEPRKLAEWRWRPLRPVGWLMSLIAQDLDGDGDPDVLFSDRRGPQSGVYWLEHPGYGGAVRGPWNEHPIGAQSLEAMFVSTADLDRDGLTDVLSAVRPNRLFFHRRLSPDGKRWQSYPILLPETAGTAKAVKAADIDLDGRTDIIFSCENAAQGKSGVMWLSRKDEVRSERWLPHDISGPGGQKYDLVELLDLDGDGDLDVVTCEETGNLGVIWYENPARSGSGASSRKAGSGTPLRVP